MKSTCWNVVCYDGDLQEGQAEAGVFQSAGVLSIVSVDHRLEPDLLVGVNDVVGELYHPLLPDDCVSDCSSAFGSSLWGHRVQDGPLPRGQAMARGHGLGSSDKARQVRCRQQQVHFRIYRPVIARLPHAPCLRPVLGRSNVSANFCLSLHSARLRHTLAFHHVSCLGRGRSQGLT